LEQEAARITGLIEECRREIDRLAITREVLPGLVAEPSGAVPAGQQLKPDAAFADQLLAVLAGAGRSGVTRRTGLPRCLGGDSQPGNREEDPMARRRAAPERQCLSA
jgi:hypothetical protein